MAATPLSQYPTTLTEHHTIPHSKYIIHHTHHTKLKQNHYIYIYKVHCIVPEFLSRGQSRLEEKEIITGYTVPTKSSILFQCEQIYVETFQCKNS